MRFIDVTKYSRYGLSIGILMSGLWIGCAGVEPDVGEPCCAGNTCSFGACDTLVGLCR